MASSMFIVVIMLLTATVVCADSIFFKVDFEFSIAFDSCTFLSRVNKIGMCVFQLYTNSICTSQSSAYPSVYGGTGCSNTQGNSMGSKFGMPTSGSYAAYCVILGVVLIVDSQPLMYFLLYVCYIPQK